MAWRTWIGFALLVTAAAAQQRQPRIEVQHYQIDAEINPHTQSLRATAQVRFVPQEDYTSTAAFELNNALNVSKVEDESGQQLSATRSHQDFSITLTFPQALPKGKPATVTFYYDGRLTGNEESPVFGIKFAAIHPDYAYLLYPARWFPVANYSTGRHTADLRITVPAGFKVIAPGLAKSEPAADGNQLYTFQFSQPAFPCSLAVVQGDPVTVEAEGVNTTIYFRDAEKDMANAHGQEIGKAMSFFTSLYGLPPQANLTVVETESGAPNGYAAPGILFFSPGGIGRQPNVRLVANQVARQWWGSLVSAATRNHLWLTNGMARYSEMLYLEHTNGPDALAAEVRDVYIDALTMNEIPVIQTPRLEDYSPEFWALTASKGAAVMHMLRYVAGDAAFFKVLKEFPNQHAWKPVTTADFEAAASAASGQDLKYFFLQWIESSGAPEFQLDYIVYRTQKGFRVMGKVAQDLDTFRMPVELRIETEGNPEEKKIEVMGTSSEFVVETFGKPKTLILDPNNRVLRYDDPTRVAVAIRRGEQFAEISDFNEALKEYQKALEVNRNSSLAHYRIAEIFFLQNNYQAAANEFREALNGDLEPKWTEVWSHINLGKIFDITGQRERAVNEYTLAMRTKDNTQGALDEAAKYLKQPYERSR
ncbi:MAG TPA: M1 family aminopeptidase [Bryobacteraceae bacterium]|nr:M1 family aminopeptidase [Bryobacteraceae bacterium]HOQ44649.1 M1 family aminopeptidase [Bryobacteraceae bacterium]HPU71859.1 M1 family aminopeptidase [Bryobacteraceae bacterium]